MPCCSSLRTADPDGFKVALMYDEDDSDPANATDAVLADLNYAYQRYISRSSQIPSSAYLRYNGQPVIFIFPKEGNTDWNRVRAGGKYLGRTSAVDLQGSEREVGWSLRRLLRVGAAGQSRLAARR